MRRTPRVWWLALVAAAGAAPGLLPAAPVRPTDPGYVVAELPGGASRSQARFAARLEESRRDPAKAAELAAELLQEARATLQPQLYGRAESVLASWVRQPQAPTPLLVMQADILQQRHEFRDSTRLLDAVIGRAPRDRQARLMRANNAIVSGDFAQARPDCAFLLGMGDPWMGTVCLAQVLGSTGQLQQARTLLGRLTGGGATAAPATLAWALQVGADMANRAGAPADAEPMLRQAVALTPGSDPARLALADVLGSQGRRAEEEAVLDMTRPSVGALLRRVELLQADGRSAPRAQALAELRERLTVSAQRGERTHLREEARLAIDLSAEPAKQLALARANFTLQRETEDVRLLARAATAARDRDALAQLRQWLLHTGYQDAIVEGLLKGGRSS
jgi:tetratricopeptide (TPR) repeat protein